MANGPPTVLPRDAPLRCFVSAARDVDRPVLSQSLADNGVEALFVEDLPASPSSVSEAVRGALEHADFVLAALSEDVDNANVMFELGMAVALGKPVLAVVPRRMVLPAQLDRQLVVRGDAADHEALRFAVEQLILRLGAHEVASPAVETPPRSRGAILGARAEELLGRLDDVLGAEAPELGLAHVLHDELVDVLHDAFRILRLPVVEGSGDARFDLGIWDSELKPLVGNPFVIEVKRELRGSTAIATALKQVEGYLAVTGGRWALLVYGSGDRALIDAAAWSRPILASSAQELVSSLKDVTFAEVVRRLRAERVHGGPPTP